LDEIQKHHPRLTLFAAAAVVFLFLLAGISHSTSLGGQFDEHLYSGVSLVDKALDGTSSESLSDVQQLASTRFVLLALQVQSSTKNVFFYTSGKRFELTAAVSPRGPPAHL
jgi:hypothetical protein